MRSSRPARFMRALPARPLLALGLLVAPLDAGEPAKTVKAEAPQRAPSLANVAYGTHERQVLDFWRAESARPTPLVFHIHGGGWVNGDKARVSGLERYLAAGISVVSINYRFVTQAIRAGVEPPASGTSMPDASAPPADQPAPAPACGSRSMTTLRILRAPTRSPASRPACGARP